MRTLLNIGSGWEQWSLVEAAKKSGFRLVATHPVVNAQGFTIADSFQVKDSRDIRGHLNIAQANRVDGIITDNCDFSLYTAAMISEKLGLPGHGLEPAIYSNNKFLQREACRKAGILQPEYRLIRTMADLHAAAAEITFPVIVKPVDSRGTFGVTIVREQAGLADAFLDAMENSHSRTAICEKFIDGTLVTVDGFCFKTGHIPLAVASRKYEPGPKPVTKYIIYPGEFSAELTEKLRENHHAVVTALSYQMGHSHGEYIVSGKGDIYLVECTNRGGGVYTSSVIVPYLTGMDLNRILISQALGEDDFHPEKKKNYMLHSAILSFLDFEVGRVIDSINTEEVMKLPYVMRFRSIYSENDMVESVENCASRHSMLVITGEDRKESGAHLDAFRKALKIVYHGDGK